ncbi:hypothetical protein KVT40_006648 [Elsinoe batatas]|uniref:Uncharacterized protein n=1 Tax=Elsinoe batatas TaxID=2601811 RepID=A0A8K0KWN0_9PEZI|nr:hypothetical protein KVT40_006648 [Elsinoe batatas]
MESTATVSTTQACKQLRSVYLSTHKVVWDTIYVALDGDTLAFRCKRSYRVADLVAKAKVAEELTNETVEQYIIREILDGYDDDMRVVGYDTSPAHVALSIIT